MSRKRCGSCVRYLSNKCSFRYSLVPIKPQEPNTVKNWDEFLKRLYDFSPRKPVLMKRVQNEILPSDIVCADWEEK